MPQPEQYETLILGRRPFLECAATAAVTAKRKGFTERLIASGPLRCRRSTSKPTHGVAKLRLAPTSRSTRL
jgi:hypothetical protein